MKKCNLTLTQEERNDLEALSRKGKHSAQTVLLPSFSLPAMKASIKCSAQSIRPY